MDFRRRDLLLASLSAALPLPGCATTQPPLCPNQRDISDAQSALTIDVHAHVFNGSDLQIQEFLSRVVVGHPNSELFPIVQALGGMVQTLAWHLAPDAAAEMRALDAYDKQMQQCDEPDGLK